MGASTRIDVKLSALVPRARGTRADSEEWTDLDVLAVEYSPLAGLTFAVADCKTLKGRVAERVFWVRGVADLFAARSAYLTRDEPIASSARQLALRLGIAVLDARDRAALIEQLGTTNLPRGGTFLERPALARWTDLLEGTPKSISRLQRYRRTIYWLVPRLRNLTYLPSELAMAGRHLRPTDLWARTVVVDLAWLYLVAVLAALDEVTRLELADPNVGLRSALLGSEDEARSKEFLASRLRTLLSAAGPEMPLDVNVLPEYHDELRDLIARFARRRASAVGALRVLEYVGVETVANRGNSWSEAFPDSSPLDAKLASDVVRFLVHAAGLDPDHVARFDTVLGAPPPQRGPGAANDVSGSDPTASHGVPTSAVATPDEGGPAPGLFDGDGAVSVRKATAK